MVGLALFIMAMVLPELRAMMLVSGVGVMIGFMVGMQQKTRHDAELHAKRAERVSSMRTIEA
jgi:hypothetical protein